MRGSAVNINLLHLHANYWGTVAAIIFGMLSEPLLPRRQPENALPADLKIVHRASRQINAMLKANTIMPTAVPISAGVPRLAPQWRDVGTEPAATIGLTSKNPVPPM